MYAGLQIPTLCRKNSPSCESCISADLSTAPIYLLPHRMRSLSFCAASSIYLWCWNNHALRKANKLRSASRSRFSPYRVRGGFRWREAAASGVWQVANDPEHERAMSLVKSGDNTITDRRSRHPCVHLDRAFLLLDCHFRYQHVNFRKARNNASMSMLLRPDNGVEADIEKAMTSHCRLRRRRCWRTNIWKLIFSKSHK